MIAILHHGCREMVEEALLHQSLPTALNLGYVQQRQPANVPHAEIFRVIKGPCFANWVSIKVRYFGSVQMTPFIKPASSA